MAVSPCGHNTDSAQSRAGRPEDCGQRQAEERHPTRILVAFLQSGREIEARAPSTQRDSMQWHSTPLAAHNDTAQHGTPRHTSQYRQHSQYHSPPRHSTPQTSSRRHCAQNTAHRDTAHNDTSHSKPHSEEHQKPAAWPGCSTASMCAAMNDWADTTVVNATNPTAHKIANTLKRGATPSQEQIHAHREGFPGIACQCSDSGRRLWMRRVQRSGGGQQHIFLFLHLVVSYSHSMRKQTAAARVGSSCSEGAHQFGFHRGFSTVCTSPMSTS